MFGLHSMSATTWSICGAYNFTCSICRNETDQSERINAVRWPLSVWHTLSAQAHHSGLAERVFENFVILFLATEASTEAVLLWTVSVLEEVLLWLQELWQLSRSVTELCSEIDRSLFSLPSSTDSGVDFSLLLVTVAWSASYPRYCYKQQAEVDT